VVVLDQGRDVEVVTLSDSEDSCDSFSSSIGALDEREQQLLSEGEVAASTSDEGGEDGGYPLGLVWLSKWAPDERVRPCYVRLGERVSV
jgi:hypothetical protein